MFTKKKIRMAIDTMMKEIGNLVENDESIPDGVHVKDCPELAFHCGSMAALINLKQNLGLLSKEEEKYIGELLHSFNKEEA